MLRFMIYVSIPNAWRRLRYGNATEDRLLEFVKSTAVEGDAASVLSAVDRFKDEKEWMVSIERRKMEKIGTVLEETKPKNCLELGTYLGYSAVSTAVHLPEGARLITVEINEKYASIAKQLVDMAGLNQVSVVTGKSSDVIPELCSRYSMDKLDYLFIDHFGSQYLPDLERLEELHLLRKGTVIVADNVLFPGCPDYIKYVEGSNKFTTERFYCKVDGLGVQDAIAISVYNGGDHGDD
ncbi:catechol O-methyltransferase-like [Acanthaster planci]|uniref:catechol O-methyltransferase n=1 Tax=Acanthaster planci TaxID=133434 RepID=A0A8B7Y9D7_ACAPL|nr:catechol O-methyltransferase-like [Acanthaster planci]XP_022089168.1 catechol O-methyltransferase-like [Acanthaster planci]